MSAIASPPPAIKTATSTSTRPRSCVGVNPRRARAPDSASVRPTRSASSRVATFPACATTPLPSAEKDNLITTTYASPAKCLPNETAEP